MARIEPYHGGASHWHHLMAWDDDCSPLISKPLVSYANWPAGYLLASSTFRPCFRVHLSETLSEELGIALPAMGFVEDCQHHPSHRCSPHFCLLEM